MTLDYQRMLTKIEAIAYNNKDDYMRLPFAHPASRAITMGVIERACGPLNRGDIRFDDVRRFENGQMTKSEQEEYLNHFS